MALVFKDRVKETTTTTGTGTITLAGAVSGFQAFSEIGDGNTTYYAIVSGTDWEVGIGTYTLSGTTLSRDTILESSNGGSAISLSGTSTVFCTYAAEKSVYRNSNDQINVTASGLIFSDSTVQTTAAAVSGDNVSIFVNDTGYLTNTSSDFTYVSGVAVYGSGHTLQTVTDNGNNTTNSILTSGNVTATTGYFDTFDMTLLGNGSQPPHLEGRLFYDSENHTITMYNDEPDISLQMGLEQYIRVRNKTGATIANGSVVRINGSHNAASASITKAIADSETTSDVAGMATHNIENNSFGYVTRYGLVRDVNTSGIAEGSEIFLSATTSGDFTATKPGIPYYSVPVGHVISSHQTNGSILIDLGKSKLSGGDLKSVTTLNQSGVPFVTYIADDNAGGVTTVSDFVYDSGNSVLYVNNKQVITSGDNVSLLNNDAGYLTTHPAISAASDSDNSGRTYIQDLLLDSYGHVTGISTATETVVDTDTTYTAGSGITIDGSDNIHVYGGSGHFIDLQLETTGIDDVLTIISTDDGSSAAPVICTMRDSASPADGDYLGQLKFKGRSDTGTERVYAKITGKTLDVTNGTEDGLIEFAVRSAGSQEIISRIRNDGWRIINDNNLYIQDNGSLGVRVDPTYSLHVKDDAYIGSGVTLPDVAPAVTTNKLYNNGGTLYFNGSAVDTDTTYTAGSGLELSGTEFNAKTATTSASGITTLTNTIDTTETKALTPKAVNDAGYITGTGNANQVAIFDTTTSVSGAQGIEIETTGDPGLDIFRKSGQTTTLVNIYTESTGILTVIDENGYIGIGTGDPTYHLQVEGTGDFDTIRFSDGSLQTTSASGAVIGPASSTDNAIARFDGATGKLIQDTSGATIDDNNILTVNGLKISDNNWWGLDSATFSTIPFESGTPTVLTFNESALNTNYVYTVRLTNRETPDFHGSSYVVYDNGGTWDTIQLSEAGTSTELPLLMESGGSVYVYLKGPTADLSEGSDNVTAHMTTYRIDQPQADGDKLSLLPEFIFSNRKNTGAGVSQARQIFPTQDGQSSGYYFGLGTTNPTEALYVADKAYIQSSYSAVTDSTDGGSLTLDFDAGNVFNVALTGNITSVTFSNADAGQKVLINVKQDNAGGYTITGGDWSATKWTDNTAPTLSTASGTVDTIGVMVPRASTYYGYTVGTGIIDV